MQIKIKNYLMLILLLLCFIIVITIWSSSNDESFGSTDNEYPGTAVQRLNSVHDRIKGLSQEQLNDVWENVRKTLLWAGGLKDLPNTSHGFNDYNHCDLTTMLGDVISNENGGQLSAIDYHNQLGPAIQTASIEELGPGGSWTTCMIGCNENPPNDVAHIQFKSRIAFKLVWVPTNYASFVLVDDDGHLLAKGTPSGGNLPPLDERKRNYELVKGSKYAVEADKS